MKKLVATVFAAACLGISLNAGQPEPEDNLGALTAWAIHELDFDQGAHSSDPSGDGQGPDTADEPRSGLANVVERGSLDLTLALLVDLLEP